MGQSRHFALRKVASLVRQLPQRVDARRRLQCKPLPAIAAGDAAGGEPAVAGEIARRGAGGVVRENVGPGARYIEALMRRKALAEIGAGGPALARKRAGER